jgi:Protein of unknown function (DUF3298)
MKKCVFHWLFFICLFVHAVYAEIPVKSFIKLSGTIDKFEITVFLTVTPAIDKTINAVANVSGIYYYNKVGQPIEVYGNLLANGNYTLTEFSINDNGAHQFNFQKKATAYLGIWQNANTKKKLAISLKEVLDGKLDLIFEQFSAEDCSTKDKILKRLSLEPEYADSILFTDTLCYTHDLDIVKLSPQQKEAKIINQLILNKLTQRDTLDIAAKSGFTDFKSYGETILDFGESPLIEQTENISLYFIDDKKMIFKMYNTSYGGGAHPNTYETFLNIDRSTNKVLTLNNVLNIKKYGDIIKEKIMLKLKQQDIWASTWFGEEEVGAKGVVLASEYAILPTGILFWYNPYEAAAYAFGPIQVFVKYSEVDPLLKF